MERIIGLLPAQFGLTFSFITLFVDELLAAHAERAGTTLRDLALLLADAAFGALEGLIVVTIGNVVHLEAAMRVLGALRTLRSAAHRFAVQPLLQVVGLAWLDAWLDGPREPNIVVPFDDGRYDRFVARVQRDIRACPPGKTVIFRRQSPIKGRERWTSFWGRSGRGTEADHSSNITRNADYKRASEQAKHHVVDVASLSGPSDDNDLTTANLMQFLNPPENTLLKVGPLMPMSAILAQCDRLSLLPPVLPEFPGLTAGGCFTGGGIETSSFRFAQWGDSVVVGVECVDGQGNFHRLAADSQEAISDTGSSSFLTMNDLKSSFGSLAVLTSLTLRLNPHPPDDHIKLSFLLCRTPETMINVIKELARMPGIDFVEGVVFSRREFVCIVGTFVGQAEVDRRRCSRWLFRGTGKVKPARKEGIGELVRFDRGFDEFYFRRVRRLASLAEPIPSSTTPDDLSRILESLLAVSEMDFESASPWVYTTIPSYVFRHDRLAFWMAYPYFFSPPSGGSVAGLGLSDTWYIRALLDPVIRTRPLYKRLHRLGGQRDFVIQDFYIPLDGSHADDESPALSFLTSLVNTGSGPGIFPIWICPIIGGTKDKGGGPGPLDSHFVPEGGPEDRMFINFGVYGTPIFRCPVESLDAPLRGVDQLAIGEPEEGDDDPDLHWIKLWTRHLERLCLQNGGRKMLYAVSTFDKAEFWSVYDRQHYLRTKAAWDPKGVFMDVDEKVLGGW